MPLNQTRKLLKNYQLNQEESYIFLILLNLFLKD